MRINDKHLAAFAVGNAPSDKEGFLQKRGDLNKAFQKRWFVLKGNLLFYFERKGDKEPIGVIILEGYTVEVAENAGPCTFEIVFRGSSSRTYILSTDTQEVMEDWMKTITCAGYDYMKVMVTDLQRQLDELNSTKSKFADFQTSFTSSTDKPVLNSDVATNDTDSVIGQLVDLSLPESAQKRERQNPFNNRHSSENVDLFGATPFQPEGNASPRCRTFEEMHAAFGAYIMEKTKVNYGN